MAQHDYNIANQSGAAFRSDLNNALAAIVSQNSGTAEPSTTFAYQLWADTTAGVLKMRNAANSAWITLRELDGTLTIENGTAAAPGLAFASDLNTGIYRVTTDSLGISTGGALRVAIDSAGLEYTATSGVTGVEVRAASLANTESVHAGGIVTASGIGRVGVYKHSGITNPTGYLRIECEDGNAGIIWVDNVDVVRVSNSLANIGTTGGTVVGSQTSDERLKNILGPVEYGLETVKQLEPVRYALKDDPTVERLGFIAQQTQPLVPEAVYDTNERIEGEPEGSPNKLAMEYVTLVPVLVNAIKELSAMNEALEARIAALETPAP